MTEDDFQQALSAYQAARAPNEVDVFNKAAMFAALANVGIKAVEVEFDGSGDSGSIESFVVCGDEFEELPKKQRAALEDAMKRHVVSGAKLCRGTQWSPDKGPERLYQEGSATLEELLQDVCYRILESEHGGWENNEGCYGTFRIIVASKRVLLTLNERIEEINTYEEEF